MRAAGSDFFSSLARRRRFEGLRDRRLSFLRSETEEKDDADDLEELREGDGVGKFLLSFAGAGKRLMRDTRTALTLRPSRMPSARTARMPGRLRDRNFVAALLSIL